MRKKNIRPKKTIKIIFFAIVNIVFFYILYLWIKRNIHIHELLFAIKQSSLFSLLLCLLISLFILVLYGKRLALLVVEPVKKAFPVVCIGFGLNNFIPFRLGDALRVYFAKKVYGFSITKMIVASFVEKYLDFLCVLICALVLFFAKGAIVNEKMFYGALILLVFMIVAAWICGYFVFYENKIKSYFVKYQIVGKVVSALENFFSNKNHSNIIGYTIAIWFCTWLVFYLYCKLNIHEHSFFWVDAFALVIITTASFAFPTVLAGIGVFESGMVFYLIKFVGLGPEQALALALMLHLIICVPQMLLTGAIFLCKKTNE
ncbi:glycosyltransferase 2 family protein [Gammaproteobacteria bacterium]